MGDELVECEWVIRKEGAKKRLVWVEQGKNLFTDAFHYKTGRTRTVVRKSDKCLDGLRLFRW